MERKEDKIIEVSGLRKSYGQVQAVKGIDFYVARGDVFAFLGPNGAGKSTTIDIICTFLQGDEGEISIDGMKVGSDDHRIRKNIGAVFQDGLLDNLLTVKENLQLRGGLYGLKGSRLRDAMDFAVTAAGVGDFLDRPYGKLSGGQRRRGDIARALINRPKVLFLDEPTTGLDPQTRKNVWDTVRHIRREENMTVFLTTHYMEEAEDADYVVVIDEGRIAAKGTPVSLKATYSSDTLQLIYKDRQSLAQKLKDGGYSYGEGVERFIIQLGETLDAIPIVERYKEDILDFEVRTGTMDDAFIGITGKEMR